MYLIGILLKILYMHKNRTLSITDGTWTKHFSYTPWTDSQFVVKEVLIDEIYNFDFKQNDIVLNLGWHHGSFDVFAYNKVKKILTFEPSLVNYERLMYNLKLNNITNCITYNWAIARYDGEIDIHISEQSWHNSCVLNGKQATKVKCYNIERILKEERPTKIKCDIEWFEYELFDWLIIPEQVNEIWFETHIFYKEQWTQHIKLIKDIKAQWFQETIYKNDEQNRTYLINFKR